MKLNDNCWLYRGDCLDIMPKFKERIVDLILCDLPYGVTSMRWDSRIDLKTLWDCYFRLLRNESSVVVLFGSGVFTVDLIMSNRKWYKYSCVWEKNVPTGMALARHRPMKYHEDIVIFCGSGSGTYNPTMKKRVGVGKECYRYDHYCGKSNHMVFSKVKKRYDPEFVQPSTVLPFRVVPNRHGKLHPTEKPVELLEYLIRTYSNENGVVLDNCMGSGSTGEACIRTGRKFVGIEQDPDYFRIAARRLKNVYNESKEA